MPSRKNVGHLRDSVVERGMRFFNSSLIASLAFAVIGPLASAAEPVHVFILAGQSNMEGKAQVKLLQYQVKQDETKERFKHLVDDAGEWTLRDDVWIKFFDRQGKLTVGFGSPDRIGPELDFGHVMGDHFDEPVLLIKTAWGGKSLYRDFRPPGVGLPDDAVLQELLENAQKRKPETTLEDIKASFGHYYREMIREVKTTLEDLGSHFPELAGRDVQLGGFVWFQGWNDMINADYTAAYAENMAQFIRDVRRDLDAPELPFVIGQLGVGGPDDKEPKKDAFKAAQAAPASLPEFKDNLAVVKTDQYWDETAQAVFDKGWRENLEAWEKVGSDYPYHYLGSARTYSDIGRAFAQALLQLGAGQ